MVKSHTVFDMRTMFIHENTVSKKDKEKRNRHKGSIIWFTGISGSGKSTLANALEAVLFKKGHNTVILDGDNIRRGLNSDLGFSKKDREENIRRIGEVAKLLADNGQIVLVAFISPFRRDRDKVRARIKKGEFIEIYVKCSVPEAIRRDPKGLYKRAQKGNIKLFTGISSPYEASIRPEITIDTEELNAADSIKKIIKYLPDKGLIN